MAWTPSPPIDGLLFRPPAHGDGLPLLRLYRQAFASYTRRDPRPDDLARCIVAELHGRLVGLGRSDAAGQDMATLLRWLRSPAGANARRIDAHMLPRLEAEDRALTAMAIDPAFRRRGIGHRLAEARIEAAELSGAHHVFVHCVRGAGTVALYQRLGFTVLGAFSKWYPRGQGMTLMAADLPR